MRIIAGSAKGTRLDAPKGNDIRPTSDRTREALFSILAPELPGSRFLDLYAGTGANGLEALSRGASRCVFVDSDKRALQCINTNVSRARLAEKAVVIRSALPRGMRSLKGGGGAFDLVFADPPYADFDYASLLEALGEHELVAPGGRMVIEHATKVELPRAAGPFAIVRSARYGKTTLTFFEHIIGTLS